MIGALILGCGILTALPPDIDSPPSPSSKEFQEYEAAAARVKRDPDAHVKLALWCEQHGLEAERLKHLGLAVLIQRDNATARGLLGQVADSDKWRKPDQVARLAKPNALTLEYRSRREKILRVEDSLHEGIKRLDDAKTSTETETLRASAASDKASLATAHYEIGDWCARHELKAESLAHFTTSTRYDPDMSDAWTRLGFIRHRGRWITRDELGPILARETREAKLFVKWRKVLRKYRADLAGDKLHRKRALEYFSKLHDPEAAPAIWSVLADDPDRDVQLVAIDYYRRIDAPTATCALTAIAALSPWDAVRESATKFLVECDQDVVVGTLLSMFRDPLRYDVRHVGGPGSPGALFVEGEKFKLQLVFTPPAAPTINLQPGDFVAPDAFGLPAVYRPPAGSLRMESGEMPGFERLEVRGDCAEIPIGRMLLQTRNAAVVSQAQLENNVAAIQQFNLLVDQINSRVAGTLQAATGQKLGADREAWRGWWCDKLGYAHDPPSTNHSRKRTYFQVIPTAYQAPSIDGFSLNPLSGYGFTVHVACFAIGTPVHTLEGPRPIESIRVGDQVLSRDVKSGTLGYHAVVANTRTPKIETLRLILSNGETIDTTPLHRFWIAGKGWTIARDLKPGDALRDLAGRVTISTVQQKEAQDVFNFEVESDCSYFVGKRGVLVHDNSVAAPVKHLFDAAPKSLSELR